MTTSTAGEAEPSDALLLGRIAAGDLDALEGLHERYRRPVYTLAHGITRSQETAEEVLQDTFYRLYTNAGKLDAAQPLLPWLYRVATNLSYNSVRRRWNILEPLTLLTERLFAPQRRSPEHLAEQRELQDIVHATLQEIPLNHRAVLTLYYLHEYSILEIADILELPEGTIKSRLHHARKLLKARLLRRYGEATTLLDHT
ncbi:MAG: RNA polymerase sigma factor [Roseiflexaceae bacterium]|nr:RNA polymerase sigma factor [Roseiflexaceae bacterium]